MGQVTASTNGLLPQWSSICDTLIFTVLAHSAELASDLSLGQGCYMCGSRTTYDKSCSCVNVLGLLIK